MGEGESKEKEPRAGVGQSVPRVHSPVRASSPVARMKWPSSHRSSAIPPALTIAPMPTIHRRLDVHWTPAGVVVCPRETSPNGAGTAAAYRGGRAVLVPWGRQVAPSELSDWDGEGDLSIDAEGIAGIVDGFHGQSSPGRVGGVGAR